MRKTFETKGPQEEGAMPLDQRARQIFAYFKKYNYDVKDAGDVIRFTGNYKASRGQAAALTFYVFMGMSHNHKHSVRAYIEEIRTTRLEAVACCLTLLCIVQCHVTSLSSHAFAARCICSQLLQSHHLHSYHVYCSMPECIACVGLGSTALVLSIAAPFGGSYWYGLTALSPLAGIYYWQKGSRVEEFAVWLCLCQCGWFA